MKNRFRKTVSVTIGILIILGVSSLTNPNEIPEDKHEKLGMAIRDLMETFGNKYPDGDNYLKTLNTIVPTDTNSFIALQKRALLANPLLIEHPVLFVTHAKYKAHYHAIDMLFHTGEFNWDRQESHSNRFEGGSSMKYLDVSTGKIIKLLETEEGLIRDPDIYFDGKKIVFAMRNNREDDYHIYEINIDGSGFKQLTSLKGVCDFDPVYLPDDKIVFCSTREPKYNKCSRDHAANLYRMNADGSNIHRITRNTLFDNHPEILPDGRILYARWEYIDRNYGDAHGIWTVKPDGTGQALYYGNNTAVPPAVFNQHLIPSTDKVVCILGNHHYSLNGAIAVINQNKGIEGKDPILFTIPEHIKEIVRQGGKFAPDIIEGIPFAKYEDVWPLSENYFLCSKTMGLLETKRGIFLVDVFGNEVIIHQEDKGCFDPMPVMARSRPAVIPDQRKYDNSKGLVYIQNVYEGTHLKGVKPGSAKYIRVVESPAKKNWSGGFWGGQGYQAPGMNWHNFSSKRIIGTVPVEEDGSAYFEVPSDIFIYYQLLDENKMMIQSMRSGTVVQPGETIGCVGCHEDRLSTPRASTTAMAMKRPPSTIEGWYGPTRKFSYTREVQPVFDRHCVECHDFEKEAGKRLILAGDRNLYFNASYIDLQLPGQKAIYVVGGGPAEIQEAYSWGSHASLLTKIVTNQHHTHVKTDLSKEDQERIITWIDLNAPYYPTYESAYPNSLTGRSPINSTQLKRLSEITGIDFVSLNIFTRQERALITFERPELSPCLKKIKDKKLYDEALAIITLGKENLENIPRCDMENFVPCKMDQLRMKRFNDLNSIEMMYREAIQKNKRMYEKDIKQSVIPPDIPVKY